MKRKAFTLIELLVVIAIIALLLAILMPALAAVKEVARAVVCRASLKQWGLVTALYSDDNDDKLYQSIVGGEIVDQEMAYWMGASLPYYDEKKVRICPSTKEIQRPDMIWNHGSTFKQWGPLKKPGNTWSESFATGSFGYNDWAACPPGGTSGNFWGLPKRRAWRTTTTSGATYVPVFADCSFYDGAVGNTTNGFTGIPDPNPEELRPISGSKGNVPFETNTNWEINAIRFFCIDRHNESINIVFLDASARKERLKGLWSLKWHKEYVPNIPAPWPAWMAGMKE